jgi:dihydroxy-acid dehydratase
VKLRCLRGAGVRGGPAMGGGASRVVFAVDGAGLGDQIAILTDGHLSGLVCKGLVVAELSPEAATGGPLALVQNGDSITIDLDTRRIDAALTEEQWQQRRDEWRAPVPAQDVGWLQQYRRNVGSLSAGAVLVRTPAKAG